MSHHHLVLAAALAACDVSGTGNVASVARQAESESAGSFAFPPLARPYGTSMVEWSQRWWQYIYAIPAAQNPMLSPTGGDCTLDQTGRVWMMSSVIDPGGTASFTRSCALPQGEALLFNLSGVLNDYPCPDPSFQPAPGQSLYAFLAEGARSIVDGVDFLSLTLDGTALPHPFDYRFTSPALFDITGDPSLTPVFDGCITGSPQPAVADGYSVMLKPPDAGAHTLTLEARDTHGTDVTITWQLTVKGD